MRAFNVVTTACPQAITALLRLLIGLAVVSGLCACEPFPQDPQHSLERIQARGSLRVGAIESPPWLWRQQDQARGVEAQLIEDFAAELGVRVQWHWGGAQDSFVALEGYDLDLVAGGLTDDNPWGRRVALTRPYHRHAARIGLPSAHTEGQNSTFIPEQVTVRPASGLSLLLQSRGISVREQAQLDRASGAVAAQDWELQRWGFHATAIELQTYARVLAVPQGENGLLVRLEDFLRRHGNGLTPAKVAEAAP